MGESLVRASVDKCPIKLMFGGVGGGGMNLLTLLTVISDRGWASLDLLDRDTHKVEWELTVKKRRRLSFNNTFNTFLFIELYTRESPPHGQPFPTAKNLLYAPFHRQDSNHGSQM